MRFTVKAKLASAFGAVIVLSMISGGISYWKLSQLVDTSAVLAQRAGRIEKAGELQNQILYQVRAEKNIILESNDAEIVRLADTLKEYRKEATRIADDIKARHDAGGQKVHGQVLLVLRQDEQRSGRDDQVSDAQFQQQGRPDLEYRGCGRRQEFLRRGGCPVQRYQPVASIRRERARDLLAAHGPA